MAITVTFSLDEETVKHLTEIAGNGQKSEKVRQLINSEWSRIFFDGETSSVPVHRFPAPASSVSPSAEDQE